LVPDVGACAECPQNTKANAPLFGDLDMGVAVCTDGGCFKAKTAEFVRIEASRAARGEAERKGQPPVPGAFQPLRVSWKATSSEPRKTTVKNDTPGLPTKGSIVINLAQIFKAGQWIEAKKQCEHTQAAITLDWSDANSRGYMGGGDKLRKPGEILQVCIEPKCKVHHKEYEKPKSENARHDPAAEKAAEEKRKALAIAEDKLRMGLVAKALEGITSIPVDALRVLAIEKLPNWPEGRKVYEALLPGLMKKLSEAKADSVELARAFALASIDRSDLVASEYYGPDHNRNDLVKAVRRLGYKGATPWDKPAPAKPAKKSATKPVAKKAPAKKAVPAKKSAAKKGGR
jgi:hypothetical protein